MIMPKPRCVIFEGPDCCGKTTQVDKFITDTLIDSPSTNIIKIKFPSKTFLTKGNIKNGNNGTDWQKAYSDMCLYVYDNKLLKTVDDARTASVSKVSTEKYVAMLKQIYNAVYNNITANAINQLNFLEFFKTCISFSDLYKDNMLKDDGVPCFDSFKFNKFTTQDTVSEHKDRINKMCNKYNIDDTPNSDIDIYIGHNYFNNVSGNYIDSKKEKLITALTNDCETIFVFDRFFVSSAIYNYFLPTNYIFKYLTSTDCNKKTKKNSEFCYFKNKMLYHGLYTSFKTTHINALIGEINKLYGYDNYNYKLPPEFITVLFGISKGDHDVLVKKSSDNNKRKYDLLDYNTEISDIVLQLYNLLNSTKFHLNTLLVDKTLVTDNFKDMFADRMNIIPKLVATDKKTGEFTDEKFTHLSIIIKDEISAYIKHLNKMVSSTKYIQDCNELYLNYNIEKLSEDVESDDAEQSKESVIDCSCIFNEERCCDTRL